MAVTASRTRGRTDPGGQRSPEARAAVAISLFAMPPALVLGVIVGVIAGWIPGLVAAVAVCVLLAGWARFGGDRVVARRLAARQADLITDARLLNLVEGLSAGAGVPGPELRVLEVPSLNVLVAGTSPEKAVLAVTSGLLSELNRVELEAVLAVELVEIRRRETLPGTVAAATFGLGRRAALDDQREERSDLAAIGLTRYPPALASAYEKMDSKGSEVPGQPAWMAHLWLADPGSPAAGAEVRTKASGTKAERIGLRRRAEALKEL